MTRSPDPDLSVVVPLHDEASNVEPLWREICRALDPLDLAWEAVLVDDGSRDATRVRLRALRDRRLRVVCLGRNYGQTAALQAGLDAARGAVIVTLDGDLQNDPADIPRLLVALEGHDLVCGRRRGRRDGLLARRLPSWLANRLIGGITGIRLHDHGCTLRAYRRPIVRSLRLYAEMHRFVGPWLVLAGCRHRELAVSHRARRHGRSKYGLSRTWKVALDLLTMKALASFATRPAAGFGLASLPFFVAAGAAVGASLVHFAAATPGQSLPVILPSAAVLCGFAACHLVLLGAFAELVLTLGGARERALVAPRAEELAA